MKVGKQRIIDVSNPKKTGKCPDYKYEADVTVETKSWFKTTKETERHGFRFYPYHYYDDSGLIEQHEYYDAVKEACKNIKSEDECCLSPDMEVCKKIKVRDIIIGLVQEREDWGYLKTGTKVYTGILEEVEYSIFHLKYKDYTCIVEVPSKGLKRYACLNCGCINNTEEQDMIKELSSFLDGEEEKYKRQIKAKEICSMYDKDTLTTEGKDE